MAFAHKQHLALARKVHALIVRLYVRALRADVAFHEAKERVAEARKDLAFAVAQSARDCAEDAREDYYDARVEAERVRYAASEEAAQIGGKL